MFKKISDINIYDQSSYKDYIYLTFDLDWCSDYILENTLNIIENYNICATFFITHDTQLLKKMRNNPKIELGIHPNFNPLLDGDLTKGKNCREVILNLMKIVPEATSVRSHSMTQSSRLLQVFDEFNIRYECNTFIPYNSGIEIKPFRYFTGNIVKVPFFWEDDIHCLLRWNWDVKTYLKYNGLKVFNFHPIHIFLNTHDLHKYEKSKYLFDQTKDIDKFVYKGYGIRNFLIDLIEEVLK